jgi:hypothetical protein
MKKLNHLLALTGACVLALSATQLSAQENNTGDRPQRRQGGEGGGRGFGGDPAEFQQRMMERVKEQLEVKDDAEWKAIEPLVTKVMEARRDVDMGRFRGAFGGRNRGGGDGGGGGGGGRGFFGEPMPEQEALQKAIESKASNADIKAAVAKYREARKAKEAALTKAQDDLKKVLSVRQEAILVNNGMLN